MRDFVARSAKAFVAAAVPAVGVGIANGIESVTDVVLAAVAGLVAGVAVWATPNQEAEQ